MVNTIQKIFILAAFVSVLFLQHPNFIEDFQKMLRSSLGGPGSPSLSSTISAMTLLYVLFLVGKRARKYADARKIAGGVGLRLHDVKTLGWIVIEVRCFAQDM
jgi:hypothetical protein